MFMAGGDRVLRLAETTAVLQLSAMQEICFEHLYSSLRAI